MKPSTNQRYCSKTSNFIKAGDGIRTHDFQLGNWYPKVDFINEKTGETAKVTKLTKCNKRKENK
jgi:hypothetical protein